MANCSYLFVEINTNIDVVKYDLVDLHLKLFKNFKYKYDTNLIYTDSKSAFNIIKNEVNKEPSIDSEDKIKIINYYSQFASKYDVFKYDASEIVTDNYRKFIKDVSMGDIDSYRPISFVDYFYQIDRIK